MSALGVVAVGLTIAVGLVGIVLPILPGTLLIAVAVVFWAAVEGGATAWLICVAALVVLAIAQALKYAIPGRRLQTAGIPTTTLVLAGALGVVGFFVIPVVGLVIGFVAGIYAAELRRLHDERQARTSTVLALRAVGLSIAIELVGGLLAAIAWLAGVVLISV